MILLLIIGIPVVTVLFLSAIFRVEDKIGSKHF